MTRYPQCCWTCGLFHPAQTAKGNPTRTGRGECGWVLPLPTRWPDAVLDFRGEPSIDRVHKHQMWPSDGERCACYLLDKSRGPLGREGRDEPALQAELMDAGT